MILYLDTSALIKLHVKEPGRDLVCAAIADATSICTSLITYAEMHAALAMARRMQRLTDSTLQIAFDDFEQEWQHTIAVTIDEPLIRRAASLAVTHKLRGYDSVHLATAELVARQGIPCTFACFDKQLNNAADSLGIDIFKSV